jgi:hypothetical protein
MALEAFKIQVRSLPLSILLNRRGHGGLHVGNGLAANSYSEFRVACRLLSMFNRYRYRFQVLRSPGGGPYISLL